MSTLIRFLLVSMFITMLVGCGASGDATTTLMSANTPTPSLHTLADNRLEFTVGELELAVQRPSDWEVYATEYGVVLAEYISSVATDGQLGGLLTHIFVPPLEDFDLQISDGVNLAWRILGQIIENPDYVGSATVSEPVAFRWNNFDAAYYLMDNGEGNVTIVVGVVPPGTQYLIACSISAPVTQSERIRQVLPELLDNLTINSTTLDGSALNTLPNPLIFPQHS
ncbi:MAG: hypothetical protein OHK0046_13080 [Anaerolineae bacterium]